MYARVNASSFAIVCSSLAGSAAARLLRVETMGATGDFQSATMGAIALVVVALADLVGLNLEGELS